MPASRHALLLLLGGLASACRESPCPSGSTRWADGLCHLHTQTEPLPETDSGHAADVPCGDVTPTTSDPLELVTTLALESMVFAHLLDLETDLERALLVAAGEGGVLTFDVSVPAEPVFLAAVSPDETTRLIDVALGSGSIAYAAAGEEGWFVVDLADPADPRIRSRVDLSGIRAIATRDAMVVVLTSAGELVIYDVTDPLDPVEGSRVGGLEQPTALTLGEGLAYVADEQLGLVSVGLSGVPEILGSTDLPLTYDLHLVPDAGVLYAAAGLDGLVTLSLDDPASPTETFRQPAGQAVRAVHVDGTTLWTADQLQVALFDVTDPHHPAPVHSEATPQFAMDVIGHNDHVWVADWEQLVVVKRKSTSPTPDLDALFTDVVPFDGRARVPFRNTGATSLHLGEPVVEGEGISVSGLPTLLEPGASAELMMDLTETPTLGSVCLATNDPDLPMWALQVDTSTPPVTDPAIGAEAPDFTLLGLDGSTYTLSDARGQPVVLLFFATWCPACAPELSEVNARLVPEWAPQGVQFWAIGSENSVEELARFTADLDLDFPVLPDPTGSVHSAYTQPEGPGLYPQQWVIGSDGRIRWVSDHLAPATLSAVLASDPALAD